MTTIRTLFPKFNVPIIFKDLEDTHGLYEFGPDLIILDRELQKSMPGCAKLVMLHEMFHSTASRKRLMRWDRLVKNFGAYVEGSLAYKMEECIVEFCTMVAAIKLGLFNEYSRSIILQGFEKYYSSDMYIPIREARAALKYFAEDETSFEEEIEEARIYLEAYMDIKFQDSYTKKEIA